MTAPNHAVLANLLLEATYKPRKLVGTDPGPLRTRLHQARRFVLDQDMSAFMGDLACAFFGRITNDDSMTTIGEAAVEDARHLAMLPFDVTWIEYDNRAKWRAVGVHYTAMADRLHIKDEFAADDVKEDEVVPREGWLCWKDPDGTNHAQTIAFDSRDPRFLVHPALWNWRTDETPTGWLQLAQSQYTASQLRPFFGKPVANTGVPIGFSYDTDQIGFALAPWSGRLKPEWLAFTINDWRGDLRYLLALLACINSDSVPTIKTYSPRPPGRFTGGGQSHAFLDYTNVSIKLPKHATSADYAARVVKRTRHRRHEVRAFLRRDRAGVKRIQVRSHFRGDASLGWIVHRQYDVTAATEPAS